jgi:hypothetical protein
MSTEPHLVFTVITLICLLILLVLPKKISYALSGVILIVLGIIPLFDALNYINLDLNNYPVLDFVIYFIIIIAGKDLFKEGVKESSGKGVSNGISTYLKYPSIFLGLLLMVITSIPKLYKFHVISWTIPTYPLILDVILYVVSGIFLIIGVFTIFNKTH